MNHDSRCKCRATSVPTLLEVETRAPLKSTAVANMVIRNVSILRLGMGAAGRVAPQSLRREGTALMMVDRASIPVTEVLAISNPQMVRTVQQ